MTHPKNIPSLIKMYYSMFIHPLFDCICCSINLESICLSNLTTHGIVLHFQDAFLPQMPKKAVRHRFNQKSYHKLKKKKEVRCFYIDIVQNFYLELERGNLLLLFCFQLLNDSLIFRVQHYHPLLEHTYSASPDHGGSFPPCPDVPEEKLQDFPNEDSTHRSQELVEISGLGSHLVNDLFD